MSKQKTDNLQIPALKLPINDNCCHQTPTNSKDNNITSSTEQEVLDYLVFDTASIVKDVEKCIKSSLPLFKDEIIQEDSIIFEAVKQNKKELVKDMLKKKPDLINATFEGYNILHKALIGQADSELIEFLLQNKPELITEKDNQNLTPLMFVEKYGFGQESSDKKASKIKKILEHYQEKCTTTSSISGESYYLDNITDILEKGVSILGKNAFGNFIDKFCKNLN